METRRWLNQSQPQTLVNAVILSYIEAAFTLLLGSAFLFPFNVLVAVGLVASGFGIANEQRWGWYLGIGLAAFELLWTISLYGIRIHIGFLLSIAFVVLRLVLLLHPQSREYQRIWFR